MIGLTYSLSPDRFKRPSFELLALSRSFTPPQTDHRAETTGMTSDDMQPLNGWHDGRGNKTT
jgi:hypothetical protein